MKLLTIILCLVLLLSGCGARKFPEDTGSGSEGSSSLSRDEAGLSFLPESSLQPEEFSLSSQSETSSSDVEPEESGLSSEVDSSAAELNLEEEIAGFEKNYYETVEPALFGDAFYKANPILYGGKIGSSKIVEINRLIYDLSVTEELNSFISDFNNGKPFSEMLEVKGFYLSTSRGSSENSEGETVVLENHSGYFKVSTVAPDGGTGFYFPSDKTLLSRICELYDPKKVTVQYVNLIPIGEGVLFSDGTQEHMVFFNVDYIKGLEENVLYSTSYIVKKIFAVKDDIAAPVIPQDKISEVNSDGEINAVTG